MGMKQIVTANGEVNASVIKGFLENNGIQATLSIGNNVRSNALSSATMSYLVFAPEEKAEEALKLLKEQGLITS